MKLQWWFVFRPLVWPTSVTVCDFPWCHWICLVEIFLMILVVLFLEFRCASKIFFFLSFFSLLSLSLSNLVFINFTIWESSHMTLQLTNHRCHLQLFKLCYFSKYFLHYVILLFFVIVLETKRTLLIQLTSWDRWVNLSKFRIMFFKNFLKKNKNIVL
jgi:hypothetical protein